VNASQRSLLLEGVFNGIFYLKIDFNFSTAATHNGNSLRVSGSLQ
jgi:hypothetical protein